MSDDPFDDLDDDPQRQGDPFADLNDDGDDQNDGSGPDEESLFEPEQTRDGGSAGDGDAAPTPESEADPFSYMAESTDQPQGESAPEDPMGDIDRPNEDPFAEMDRPPEGDPFADFGGTDAELDDAVWDDLSSGMEAETVSEQQGTRRVSEVSKHSFCEQCEHFTGPPDIACTNEGTDILEFLDMETVRVADCPVVAEREEIRGAHE